MYLSIKLLLYCKSGFGGLHYRGPAYFSVIEENVLAFVPFTNLTVASFLTLVLSGVLLFIYIPSSLFCSCILAVYLDINV